MRPIPLVIRKKIDADPFYKSCVRLSEGGCDGRITIEHALQFQGRQLNELFALLPLCWRHHLGKGLSKEYNRHVALQRATDADLAKYSRANWKTLKTHLEKKYGPFPSKQTVD